MKFLNSSKISSSNTRKYKKVHKNLQDLAGVEHFPCFLTHKDSMSEAVKVTIKCKNDDGKKLQKERLIYEEFMMSSHDRLLGSFTAEVLKEFGEEPTDVEIIAKLTL